MCACNYAHDINDVLDQLQSYDDIQPHDTSKYFNMKHAIIHF